MNEPKHTPGPWEVEGPYIRSKNDPHKRLFVLVDAVSLCKPGICTKEEVEEAKANLAFVRRRAGISRNVGTTRSRRRVFGSRRRLPRICREIVRADG